MGDCYAKYVATWNCETEAWVVIEETDPGYCIPPEIYGADSGWIADPVEPDNECRRIRWRVIAECGYMDDEMNVQPPGAVICGEATGPGADPPASPPANPSECCHSSSASSDSSGSSSTPSSSSSEGSSSESSSSFTVPSGCPTVVVRITVSGVDAGICPDCCAEGGNQKWTTLSVDGVYEFEMEWCNGGGGVSLPSDNAVVTRYEGEECTGGVQTTIQAPEVGILFFFNTVTGEITFVRIGGQVSDSGLPPFLLDFIWTGSASFGQAVANQASSCNACGYSDTTLVSSTTGTVRIEIIDILP